MATILIVGAGAASVPLIEMLGRNKSLAIAGVVDPDAQAPGVRAAAGLGIPTDTRWEAFLDRREITEVIDLTGDTRLREALAADPRRGRIALTDGRVAGMMCAIALDCARSTKALQAAQSELEIQQWGLGKTNEAIKLLYDELAEKNRMLKRSERLKSDFLSMVSHELQTPLAIMKEYALLLADGIPGPINEGQKEYLDIVVKNINRLSRLINDLLDIAKIEAKKIDIWKEPVDIGELARETVAHLKIAADKKRIDLKAVTPAERVVAYADPDKIVQILTNLIGNAIKFTPEGGQVTVDVLEKTDEIECGVTDTGVGIETKDLDRIFTRFQQFNRKAGPGSQGTGLGLAISRELVLLHNGTMRVDSEPGKGTSFRFTLPRAAHHSHGTS